MTQPFDNTSEDNRWEGWPNAFADLEVEHWYDHPLVQGPTATHSSKLPSVVIRSTAFLEITLLAA
jgi:hypothetical protein